VDRKTINTDQPKPRWFINLDWYQQSNRSLSSLVQICLCPKHQKQLSTGGKEISTTELMAMVKDCCAKKPGFITGQLPLLESVFRLFLANGNQPLTLEELGNQLSEQRGVDTYRTSEEILSRLLKTDQYYGLQLIPS